MILPCKNKLFECLLRVYSQHKNYLLTFPYPTGDIDVGKRLNGLPSDPFHIYCSLQTSFQHQNSVFHIWLTTVLVQPCHWGTQCQIYMKGELVTSLQQQKVLGLHMTNKYLQNSDAQILQFPFNPFNPALNKYACFLQFHTFIFPDFSNYSQRLQCFSALIHTSSLISTRN